MNTKDNQRSRDTDERIIRAVYEVIDRDRKKVSQITVREICEKAEINRSTFYAHYMDVFEVVEKVERHMSQGLTEAFLNALDQGENIGSCFIKLFEYIRQYKDFYRYYLNETNNTGVISLAWDLIRERSAEIKPETVGMSSEREMEFSMNFFLYGITAMIRVWLNSGCQETSEELFHYLCRQFDEDRLKVIVW